MWCLYFNTFYYKICFLLNIWYNIFLNIYKNEIQKELRLILLNCNTWNKKNILPFTFQIMFYNKILCYRKGKKKKELLKFLFHLFHNAYWFFLPWGFHPQNNLMTNLPLNAHTYTLPAELENKSIKIAFLRGKNSLDNIKFLVALTGI